jgi:FtsZ-binding cell division protein ZapB
MDADAIITILIGVAGVVGGLIGGKRLGHGQAQQAAVSTVELLQVAVAELERQGRQKDDELSELRGRVSVLEDLVTQRAQVEEVKILVDKIAVKLGA